MTQVEFRGGGHAKPPFVEVNLEAYDPFVDST